MQYLLSQDELDELKNNVDDKAVAKVYTADELIMRSKVSVNFSHEVSMNVINIQVYEDELPKDILDMIQERTKHRRI